MGLMATNHPSDWIGVAVHNGDPMVVTDYDAAMGTHISGYPSGLIDRQAAEVDPQDFETAYTARVAQIAPVDMSITNVTWNSFLLANSLAKFTPAKPPPITTIFILFYLESPIKNNVEIRTLK